MLTASFDRPLPTSRGVANLPFCRKVSHPLGFLLIDLRKLRRAHDELACLPYPELGKRVYLVLNPSPSDHDTPDNRQQAVLQQEDREHWVNLSDRDVDWCYCHDFLYRCEETRQPCKHILAALLLEETMFAEEGPILGLLPEALQLDEADFQR